MLRRFILAGLALTLAAWDAPPPPSTHVVIVPVPAPRKPAQQWRSVSWYRANQTEMDARLRWCADNPASDLHSDCVNARAARNQVHNPWKW